PELHVAGVDLELRHRIECPAPVDADGERGAHREVEPDAGAQHAGVDLEGEVVAVADRPAVEEAAHDEVPVGPRAARRVGQPPERLVDPRELRGRRRRERPRQVQPVLDGADDRAVAGVHRLRESAHRVQPAHHVLRHRRQPVVEGVLAADRAEDLVDERLVELVALAPRRIDEP
ncbi:MAG: hypothetical protein ACK55I_13550, partial [bacterium]